MAELIAKPPEYDAGTIETAAACAMLHSFYTEIEKIMKLIAQGWDRQMPSADAWHKELLNQMATPAETRPAVFAPSLVETLGEYLAFRHLFRGASIVLMRWNKLRPLIAKVDDTYGRVRQDLECFCDFIQSRNPTP